MAEEMNLPEGFILDEDISLPEGFILDEPTTKKEIPLSFGRLFFNELQKDAQRKLDYLFPQLITGAKFGVGRMNIYGDIGERFPGALRAGISALETKKPLLTEIKRGFQRPEEIPSFAEQLALKTPIESKTKFGQMAELYPAAFTGTALDIAINPWTYIGGAFGKFASKELPKAGKLVSGITKEAIKSPFGKTIIKGFKGIPNIFPRIMGENYTYDRAVKAINFLDDKRAELGKIKNAAIKFAGNRVVNPIKLQEKLPKIMPKEVIDVIHNPIYEIEIMKDGSIVSTLENLDKVKMAIGDLMSNQAWLKEAPNKSKEITRQIYGIISKEMKTAYPDIAPAVDDYHNFMDIFRDVNKTLRDTSGRILEKRLRGTFAPRAEQEYKIAWEKMKNYIPELERIMTDIKKYIGRINTKDFLKRLGTVGLYRGTRF